MVIEPAAYFLWALLLLLLPLKWLFAAVVAAAFHELSHWAALRASGHRPTGIRLGITGCEMDVQELGYAQELLCALAGPAGSFLLILSSGFYPQLALCAALQGIFNLLPVYPLDGGRAVAALAGLTLPPRSARFVCAVLKYTALTGIFLFLMAVKCHYICLYAGIWVLSRYLCGKIPCKRAHLRVQ